MKPEFLNLFRELCEEQVMLYIDPEGVKTKKKQRKIDFEVSDLRLKLANSTGKNVVLSNREIRLLRYEIYDPFFWTHIKKMVCFKMPKYLYLLLDSPSSQARRADGRR